jgi:hypothetical protein
MQTHINSDTLRHAGVKGMKWGVRRYQNKDGSLTPAGKKRYSVRDVAKKAADKAVETAKTVKKNTTVGKRRYQSKDGELTDFGKKRLERDIRENEAKKKDNRITIDKDNPDVSRWVKEDIKRSKEIVDASSTMVKELKNIERQIPTKPKVKMDLSHMTDQQMRSEINRAMLERQYNDMFAPQNTSRGREYVKEILSYAGSTLAITSSALGIALAIKELRG